MDAGLLLIDKTAGPTSHDVINAIRRVTGIRKVGHAGTLDPFATGLLIVAVGREATREISQFVGQPKVYEATIVLGATTETLDPEGDVVLDPERDTYTLSAIQEAAQTLTGTYGQIPPMYSAIKKQGKKLYELAREGKTIEREPREVTVTEFSILGVTPGFADTTDVRARIACSSGTYIRAMARDLAETLDTSGYLTQLRRTSIGPFPVGHAVTVDTLSSETWGRHLLSIDDALAR